MSVDSNGVELQSSGDPKSHDTDPELVGSGGLGDSDLQLIHTQSEAPSGGLALTGSARLLLEEIEEIVAEVKVRLKAVAAAADSLADSPLRELILITITEVVERRERERQIERERAADLEREEREVAQLEQEAATEERRLQREAEREASMRKIEEMRLKEQQAREERESLSAATEARRAEVNAIREGERANRMTDNATFRAWHGDNEQILKLWDAICSELGRNESVRILRGESCQPQVAAAVSTPDTVPSAELLGRRGKIRKVGSLPDLLTQVEVEDVESLTISNGLILLGSDHPVIKVEFGSRDDDHPVSLTVVGQDSTWVVGVTASLSKELQRAVPWYAVFRAPSTSVAVTSTVALSLLIATMQVLHRAEVSLPNEVASILVIGLWWSPLLLHYGIKKFIYWAIPAFELSRQGKSGRSARVAAAILGALSIVPGIVGLLLL